MSSQLYDEHRKVCRVLIIGLGEVGKPLFEIVRGVYEAYAYDFKLGKVDLPERVDVLHICYPYNGNFIRETVNYAIKFRPKLLIIESTVPPGVTTAISIALKKDSVRVVHSPVNGRAADGMKHCLYNYTKFIGPTSKEAGEMADEYYRSLGFKTRVFSSSFETEFAKLIDLAYFAVMLGWNQEMRRITEKYNLNFNEIAEFLNDVTVKSGYRFPRPVYDGKPIGGHCVIPAVEMLLNVYPSKFLEAVLESNKKRVSECSVKG